MLLGGVLDRGAAQLEQLDREVRRGPGDPPPALDDLLAQVHAAVAGSRRRWPCRSRSAGPAAPAPAGVEVVPHARQLQHGPADDVRVVGAVARRAATVRWLRSERGDGQPVPRAARRRSGARRRTRTGRTRARSAGSGRPAGTGRCAIASSSMTKMLAAPVFPRVCRLVNQRSSSIIRSASRSSAKISPAEVLRAVVAQHVVDLGRVEPPCADQRDELAQPHLEQRRQRRTSWRSTQQPGSVGGRHVGLIEPGAHHATGPASATCPRRSGRRDMHTGCSCAWETRCIQSSRRLSPSGRGVRLAARPRRRRRRASSAGTRRRSVPVAR